MAGALFAVAVLADTVSAGTVPGAEGMSERQLRAAETRLFGPAHAAEHAVARSAARAAAAAPGVRVTAREARAVHAAQAADAATDGRWTTRSQMPVIGVHAALLPTGKVMTFSQRINNYAGEPAAAYLWDPTKAPRQPGEFKAVPPPANSGAAPSRCSPTGNCS